MLKAVQYSVTAIAIFLLTAEEDERIKEAKTNKRIM